MALPLLAILLDGCLEGTIGSAEILRHHDRMDLNARIEREKLRLDNRGDLGGVLHVEEKKCRPLSIVVREIHGFGLQICQDGMDGGAELAGLRSPVPSFDRDVHLDKKAHRSPRDEWWIVAVPDIAAHAPSAAGLPFVDGDVLPNILYGLPPSLGSQHDGVRASFKRPVTRHLHLIDRKCEFYTKRS